MRACPRFLAMANWEKNSSNKFSFSRLRFIEPVAKKQKRKQKQKRKNKQAKKKQKKQEKKSAFLWKFVLDRTLSTYVDRS